MSKSDKIQLTVIFSLAVIMGFIAFTYANNTIDAIQVEKPQGLVETSQLSGATSDPAGRIVTVYQEQGGNRQTVQVTATNNIAPQHATVRIQGNDPENESQPALGYGALNWTLQ